VERPTHGQKNTPLIKSADSGDLEFPSNKEMVVQKKTMAPSLGYKVAKDKE